MGLKGRADRPASPDDTVRDLERTHIPISEAPGNAANVQQEEADLSAELLKGRGRPTGQAPAGDPDELLVSEIFGPTFQGEGASLGRRSGFLRLGRCNLDCGKGAGATWACDTSYTWDWDAYDPATELQPMSVAAVVDRLSAMDVDLVVVTGGEPLLQQRRLIPFLRAAAERGWAVEVETNGTIAPLPQVTTSVTRFNVSPKLLGSGVGPERALRPPALVALRDSGRAVFKFVVSDPGELDEVASVANTYRLAPIWIMPAGTTAGELLATSRLLADPVLERGWHLTTRLHVLLWGDQRGR